MVTTVVLSCCLAVPYQAKVSELSDPFQAALVAALHRFADEGELDHLKAILKKYPNLINAKQTFRQPRKPCISDSFTLLHRAAGNGHEQIAKYLLVRGADVNQDDGSGWSPLHSAAENGNLAIVKLLVKHGANPNAKTLAIPEGVPPGADVGLDDDAPKPCPAIPSMTPLDRAKLHKHADVVKFLRSIAK